jgi:hypothetical protein
MQQQHIPSETTEEIKAWHQHDREGDMQQASAVSSQQLLFISPLSVSG